MTLCSGAGPWGSIGLNQDIIDLFYYEILTQKSPGRNHHPKGAYEYFRCFRIKKLTV